jgi:pimeloyl-ACP methyl ester carboxylesterase
MRALVAVLIALVPVFSVCADDKPKLAAKDPVGLWLGVLKVGPIHLRMAYQIDRDKKDETKLTAKLISVDQGMAEVPMKTATFADGKLTIELPAATILYTATFDDKGALDGEFKQGAQKFPLKLEWIEKLPTMNRPQMPKEPYPYPSEKVTFENDTAKIKLAGTLTLPKGDGPFPAVVLVSGSGPQDRDETLFGHKPFLVIADHLAKNGIACLRYADRGMDGSGGKFAGATSADFATDAHAAVKFLKADKRVDAKRIGICGHSEGGIIAPLVAADHPDDVAFIVLLAGPGISGERVMYEQAYDFSKLADEKVTEKEIQEFVDAVMPIMRSDKPTAEAKKELTEAMLKIFATEKDEKKRKQAEEALPASIDRLADPWFRWFVCHDPAPTLAKVKCPVLALNGEKDVQVKAKQNLEVIESTLKKAGHKAFQAVELKGLNHLFQTCKTGQLLEYGEIEETFAPDALKRISDWVNERK